MPYNKINELISQRKEWEVWADCGNGLERQTAVENLKRIDLELSKLQRYKADRQAQRERKRERKAEAQAANKAAAESGGDRFVFVIFMDNDGCHMARQVRVGNLHLLLQKIDQRRNWKLAYVSLSRTWTVGNDAKLVGRVMAQLYDNIKRFKTRLKNIPTEVHDRAASGYSAFPTPGWSFAAKTISEVEKPLKEARQELSNFLSKLDNDRLGVPGWRCSWPPRS